MTASPEKKLGNIAIVMDERISREKAQILTRAINALRPHANILLLGGQTTEAQLIQKLQDHPVALVLLPWHRYLAWSKVEGFFGLTRTSGPTIAGYFADAVKPYEIGEPNDYLRSILLDFAQLSVSEILMLVRSLARDQTRSGLRPLLEPNTSIYCETWFAPQGHGTRVEQLLALPEIAAGDWTQRGAAIRIVLQALWSLVYEEGSGKGDFAQTIAAKSPKAYFQFAADRTCLAIRVLTPLASWNPKSTLRAFWPDARKPTAPPQLIGRYADFVRVHSIADTNDVEITVGFLPSAPAERSPETLRTFWVEPLSPQAVLEIPFEAPGPTAPHLKHVPGSTVAKPMGAGSNPISESDDQSARERFIFNAATKLQELKRALQQKDELIRELRMGGIGTAPPLPPPDAKALLDALQERFLEVRFQVRELEHQLRDAERKSGNAKAIDQLRSRMQTLLRQEKEWLDLLAQANATLQQARKLG